MSGDGEYVRKRQRPQMRALPGAWLHSLAFLLEAGQASTDDVAHEGSGYVAGTIRSALSNMHTSGFVQRCPGKLWGLTKAGIDAALQAEEDALALTPKIGNHRSPFGMGS